MVIGFWIILSRLERVWRVFHTAKSQEHADGSSSSDKVETQRGKLHTRKGRLFHYLEVVIGIMSFHVMCSSSHVAQQVLGISIWVLHA